MAPGKGRSLQCRAGKGRRTEFESKEAAVASLVARWESVCLQCGRPGFHPWVGKIPWRRKWQPTPVFLPGESHGWRNLVGYSPWGRKGSGTTTLTAFLWCWRRLLRVPWTARRSNQSILKEISPEHSLEGLMLKLKLQYFGYLMQRTDSFEKTLMLAKTEGGRRRGQQRMR